jgi:Mg2+ and Co2+ transporter CorA
MVLSTTYNFEQSLTTAYLGFDAEGPASAFIDALKKAPERASHPMLLPILLTRLWVNHMRSQTELYGGKLGRLQDRIGLAQQYRSIQGNTLSAMMDVESRRFDKLRPIHEHIIELHNLMTNGTAKFMQTMVQSTLDVLKVFEEKNLALRAGQASVPSDMQTFTDYSNDFRDYLEVMQARVQTEMNHRTRYLERVQLLLQVMHSLMQQDLAEQTWRDSSAMKSIAVLTMVFLPCTAIANIIGPFVQFDRDAGSFRMVPQFGIFWAIAAPVTVLVILVWVIWSKRDQLRATLKRWHDFSGRRPHIPKQESSTEMAATVGASHTTEMLPPYGLQDVSPPYHERETSLRPSRLQPPIVSALG